jgi:hypothetical protein
MMRERRRSDARRGLFAWDARNDQLAAVGYIVGAAMRAVAISMAVGKTYETALAEVENDPDWLADMTFAMTKGDGLRVSRTDLKDTIVYGMTAHGRLEDWLLPERIEKMCKDEATKLASFLDTALNDLRDMSAAELSSRIYNVAAEHRQRRILRKSVGKQAS